MGKRLNFKIIGSGPTGLLLSIVLSNLDLNIYLTDLLSKKQLINKDKTYAITHSTRKILMKFSIWNKLKPYLFGFDTLSITDSVTSSHTLLTKSDLDKDICHENMIGWVIKHSDLMNVFFQEINNRDNIFFINPQKLALEKKSFDYEFISTGAQSVDKRFINFLNFKKAYNQSCLTFKVLTRSNLKSRAYEIFRDEGPLALLPLDNNLYQIIWTSKTSKSIDRLNTNKSFLLDNLTTILPKNFKLDQIVGEINIFPVSLSLNLHIFPFTNSVVVGDAFHTFHPVGGQGLNTCWRDVNTIYNILNNPSYLSYKSLSLFKYKYYSRRFIDILLTSLVTDFLIKTFANKNLILFPLRKISFLSLNKFGFIRKYILNHMTKSFVYKSIK